MGFLLDFLGLVDKFVYVHVDFLLKLGHSLLNHLLVLRLFLLLALYFVLLFFVLFRVRLLPDSVVHFLRV